MKEERAARRRRVFATEILLFCCLVLPAVTTMAGPRPVSRALSHVMLLVAPIGIYLLLRERKEQAHFIAQLRDADDHLCPHCEYRLEGLPEIGCCPECGLPYRLEELKELWEKRGF